MKLRIPLLIIAFCFTASAGEPLSDPIIEGRPLSSWIADSASNDNKKVSAARTTLEKLSPVSRDAIPRLVEAIVSEKGEHYAVVDALRRIKPDVNDAAVLIDGYRRILSAKNPRDHQKLWTLKERIREIGVDALPVLAPLLVHEIAGMRKLGAEVVGHWGSNARALIPALSRLLADPDYALRHQAAHSIFLIDPSAVKAALEMLAADAKSRDRNTQDSAFIIINAMGEGAGSIMATALSEAVQSHNWRLWDFARARPEASIPILSGFLKSEDAKTRRMAVSYIGQIGSPARVLEDKFIALMDDPDKEVASQAIYAMKLIDPTHEKAVPALIAKLDGEHSDAAARSLAEFGAAAHAAIPGLTKLLAQKKFEAARALARIAPETPGIAELALEQFTRNQSFQWEREILQVFAELGLRADSVMPNVLSEFEKNPAQMAEVAVRMRWRSKALLPMIITRLREDKFDDIFGKPETVDPDADTDLANYQKSQLVEAAVSMGIHAKLIIPVMLQNVKLKRHASRAWALDVIERIGRDAYSDEVVAFLKEEVDRPQRPLPEGEINSRPMKLCSALAKFEEKAVWALPMIARVLDNEEYSWQAVSAIESILSHAPVGDHVKTSHAALMRFYEKCMRGTLVKDRVRASSALIKLKSKTWSAAALQQLSDGLSDRNLHVRELSLEQIAELGEDARPLVKKLAAMLRFPSDLLRTNVLACLEKLGGRAREAVPEIVNLLDWNNRGDPALAEEFNDAFNAGLADDGYYISSDGRFVAPIRASTALLEIDRNSSANSIPFLLKSLNISRPYNHNYTIANGMFECIRENKETQIAAAESILKLGGEGKREALVRLRELLNESSWRDQAARALARYAPEESEVAVPILVEILYRDGQNACDTIKLLEPLGMRAKAALPLLKEMSEQGNYELRNLAVNAVIAIERK